MPLYKKEDLSKIVKAIRSGRHSQVYLIVGDRFLCRQAAENIAAVLMPDSAGGSSLNQIDGDLEDPLKTLALFKSYSLFGGRQIFQINGSKLFHSKAIAKGIWNKARKVYLKKDLEGANRYLGQLATVGQCAVGEMAKMSESTWHKAFGFAKPQESLAWIAEVLSSEFPVADENHRKGSLGSVTEQYESTLIAGGPDENILILLAETVDKRKKFYKFILKQGVVIDLAVDAGFSKGAKASQETVLRELIRQTLAEFDKSIEPQAVTVLIERVGFHPVAIVRETEKLALYVDDLAKITLQDILEIVGRTREDALFELTDAFSEFDLERSLVLVARLVEAGVHPLVLLAGLRNYLRKLLLVRSFMGAAQPVFVPGMTYGVFQKGYLPDLKQRWERWMPELPSHPYALFMMFNKAKKMTISELMAWMRELLQTELILKSAGQSPVLVLENFLIMALVDKRKGLS